MPRLFTALELPERVAGQLALARGGVVGARWLEPGDYHITLRFVGDIDARRARDIAETLGDIRRPKVFVRFEGLSWFGGDEPRAIVARVKADPALMDLQAEQERRLRRIGVEPETRKYTPVRRKVGELLPCPGRGDATSCWQDAGAPGSSGPAVHRVTWLDFRDRFFVARAPVKIRSEKAAHESERRRDDIRLQRRRRSTC